MSAAAIIDPLDQETLQQLHNLSRSHDSQLAFLVNDPEYRYDRLVALMFSLVLYFILHNTPLYIFLLLICITYLIIIKCCVFIHILDISALVPEVLLYTVLFNLGWNVIIQVIYHILLLFVYTIFYFFYDTICNNIIMS